MKNDKIQNGRRLFEKLYISTQKRKTQVKKIYQYLWYQLTVTSKGFYIDI